LPLPAEVVMAVISSVRSDDVYNQVPHYPSPDHRTTALAHQAAGLYIALYYVPQVLQKDTAVMRALVDRHFCDCWVRHYFFSVFIFLTSSNIF
jgi:WASH complex subunit strumpellin